MPLSAQTVGLLHTLHTLHIISGHSAQMFPGERDHDKPMSTNTILGALKRMGYAGRMTGHGFRGVASTLLHEQGFDHAHIELQLAHQERDAVSAAYNHATYLPQRKLRRTMAQIFTSKGKGAKLKPATKPVPKPAPKPARKQALRPQRKAYRLCTADTSALGKAYAL